MRTNPSPAPLLDAESVASVWSRPSHAYRRRRADEWRRVRQRIYALPPHIRASIHVEWTRYGEPKEPASLSALVWRVCKKLGAAPEDFPELSPASRQELTAILNDRARLDDPETRCQRIFSAGALLWLAPGWTPRGEAAYPILHVETCDYRLAELTGAIAGYSAFDMRSDPTGERREGRFTLGGAAFVFRIFYRRPGSGQECPTPWNADLSTRLLWVARADEASGILEGLS